ncbi:transcription factor 4-like [Agrilus planipennis]|uniref:Transcription factor 4-like n=1 Tax=Agrilus planipennis TaxID=224129 RepID=A0A1W4XF37_AGRPL|nr:transcription factor 4-like [Agrilus planipennis]
MEERLDDAINVLRNHAESQINLGQLPPNLSASQVGALNYTPSTSEVPFSEPIKVERTTHHNKKRKEPPDSDSKPSSSVDSITQPNSTSIGSVTKASKRSRRYDDDDDDTHPGNKAVREKERRHANNIRERYVEIRF